MFPNSLTLNDRAPIRTLSDWRGEGGLEPPPLSRKLLKIETYFFSGGSCAFLEKITFSSHSGETTP